MKIKNGGIKMIIEVYCSYGLIVLTHVPNDIKINKNKLGTWVEAGIKYKYIKRARRLTGFRSRSNKWINRYLISFNDIDDEWKKELPIYDESEDPIDEILE